jgi:hypothetical protein
VQTWVCFLFRHNIAEAPKKATHPQKYHPAIYLQIRKLRQPPVQPPVAMGGQTTAKPYLFGRPVRMLGMLCSVTSDSAVCTVHTAFALPLRTQRPLRSIDLVLKSTLALPHLTGTVHRAELRSEYQQAKGCLTSIDQQETTNQPQPRVCCVLVP